MVNNSTPYAQVSLEDLEESLASNSTCRTTTTFSHIEEARNLSWTDSFYDGKHGIVAAFDRDGASAGNWFMWRFLKSAMVFYGASIFYWIMGQLDMQYSQEETILDDICGVYMLVFGTIFVFLAVRGRQALEAQHIAISTEGIRIDNGSMVSITIPFEHIQKIHCYEHMYCCKQLSAGFQTVAVHRTAAPLERMCFRKTKKLELYGINEAQAFVNLVVAMKDSQDNGTYEGADVSRVELQQMD